MFHATASVMKSGVCLGVSMKLQWEGYIVHNDVEGCFLIVKGSMCDIWWILVGVYAPQSGRGIFFTNLIEKIYQFAEGNLILMEDFNVVLNVYSDTLSQSPRHSVLPQIFKKWLSKNEVRVESTMGTWKTIHIIQEDMTVTPGLIIFFKVMLRKLKQLILQYVQECIWTMILYYYCRNYEGTNEIRDVEIG